MFHAVAVALGMNRVLEDARRVAPELDISTNDFSHPRGGKSHKSRRGCAKAVLKRRRRNEIAFESRRRNR